MQRSARWAVGVVALALAMPGTAAADGVEAALAPQLAVQPDGRAHFAWDWFDGRTSVVQERSRSTAGDFWETQWVSPAGQGSLASDIATDGAGNAAIVWLGAYGPVVRMRWREADGGLHPTQTLSNAGAVAADAQVAVDATGITHAAWVELLPGDQVSVVRTRRRAADGTLGPIQTLSATSGRARLPRVAVDKLGNAVFAWQRKLSGGATVVEARRRAAGGTLSATQTLSATTGTHHEVDLGLDESGAAVVSWLRHAGATTGVELRRRAPDGTLTAIQALTGQVADDPALGPLIEEPRIAPTAA